MSVSLFAKNYDIDQIYFKAIRIDNLSKVKELVESNKVDINILYRYNSYFKDYYPVNPLAAACIRCSTRVATYLIHKGAKINVIKGRSTPLYNITYKTCLKNTGKLFFPLIKLLLDKGADPNLSAKNTSNYPLIIAARTNRMDLVKLLLKYGAKKDIKDYKGKTPVWYAKEAGYVEMANFLEGKSNDAYHNSLFYAVKTGDLKKSSQILKDAGSKAQALVAKKDIKYPN